MAKTDARGITINYSFDALNRLTGKTYTTPSTPPTGYAPTASVSYTYDGNNWWYYPIGRRTGMTDATGQQTWGYDPLGRTVVIGRTIATPQSTQNSWANFQYKINGALDFGRFYDGMHYRYTYDSAGRATGVNHDNEDGSLYAHVASSASYDAAGHLMSLVQGGTTTTNSYNNRLQPTLLSAATSSQTLFSHTLCYKNCYSGAQTANNGNILEDVDNKTSAKTAYYRYDTLNRLVSAQTQNTWGDAYTYDPFGNLYQMTPIGGGVGQTLNAGLPSQNNRLPGVGLSYDAAGNVTVDNLGTHYTYDAEGRVATAGSWTYSYDGDGKRVLKTAGGSTGRTFWYGADGTLTDEQSVEINSGCGCIAQNNRIFYFNGHLAETLGFPANTIAGDLYVMYDQIGSTRMTVDINNGSVSTTDYYPFGAFQAAPSDDLEQRFSGKERDAENGNDYFAARYYGSSVGRFISPDDGSDQDPEDPQSWNLYAYVRDNPLTNTDPDGHGCETVTYSSTYEGKTTTETWAKADPECGSALLDLMWHSLQNGGKNAANMAAEVGNQAMHYLQTTDWSCVGKYTRGGIVTGAGVGTVTGLAGLAGGPAVLVTEPSAILGEAAWGGGAGLASGLGMCGGSFMARSSGGGSGGSGPKEWQITDPADTKTVGNRTYMKDANTGLWWSKDTAGHGGSVWKVFKQVGSNKLQWIADADAQGDYITGKWKSPVGMTVSW